MYAVWIGRTRYKKHTTLIAAIISIIVMIISAAAFSAGCWYVKDVWYDDDIEYQDDYKFLTFFGWLGLCVLANYLVYRLTRRKLAQAATEQAAAAAAGSSSLDGTSTNADEDFEAAKSRWRYQSGMFEPPESVCFAATELSKATAHVAVATVRSPFQKAGSALSRMRSNSFAASPSHHNNTNRSRTSSNDSTGSSSNFGSPVRSPRYLTERDNTTSSANRPRFNTDATAASSSSTMVSSSHHNY